MRVDRVAAHSVCDCKDASLLKCARQTVDHVFLIRKVRESIVYYYAVELLSEIRFRRIPANDLDVFLRKLLSGDLRHLRSNVDCGDRSSTSVQIIRYQDTGAACYVKHIRACVYAGIVQDDPDDLAVLAVPVVPSGSQSGKKINDLFFLHHKTVGCSRLYKQ